PLTGRQHQLRAHMALGGHPIVGDKLYGMGDVWFDAYTRGEQPEPAPATPRHLLHAHVLDLGAALPDLVLKAPMPDDWPSSA
ncbi:MAG: RNA pseudouridine synthase, partial [Myxococcales bacterium]|nr:RNA pseudouridine synthase [Myxococcales bacterium]